MKQYVLALTLIVLSFLAISAQELDKTWQFESIQNVSGDNLFSIDNLDTLRLNTGEFYYSLKAKDNLKASGDYIYQNNLLVFYYNYPTDTIRRYKITELTDSTLVFTEKEVRYAFKAKKVIKENTTTPIDTIITNQGFSIHSFWRGVLGMFALLLISFLLSKNRRAINWRTVSLGLLTQLILAIGVLKVPFIQGVFEWVGSCLLYNLTLPTIYSV